MGRQRGPLRTFKNLLKKSNDPCLALMTYHSAPLANGHRPIELLMVKISAQQFLSFHPTSTIMSWRRGLKKKRAKQQTNTAVKLQLASRSYLPKSGWLHFAWNYVGLWILTLSEHQVTIIRPLEYKKWIKNIERKKKSVFDIWKCCYNRFLPKG